MSHQDSIHDELKALDSSLPTPPQPLYSLPPGYFEGFAASVMARLKEDQMTAAEEIAHISPLLAGLSRTVPFTVPEHYFEDNLESLYAVVGDEPASTFLSSVPKDTPYTLPEGYFEGLGSQIAAKIERPAAPVMRMTPRRWMPRVAAAVVAGAIAVSGFFYFNHPAKKAVEVTASIRVDNPHWMASKLQNVSSKDIEEFVQSADVTAATSPAKAVAKTADVKKLLRGVSDKDMDAFLSQIPDEDEELALN